MLDTPVPPRTRLEDVLAAQQASRALIETPALRLAAEDVAVQAARFECDALHATSAEALVIAGAAMVLTPGLRLHALGDPEKVLLVEAAVASSCGSQVDAQRLRKAGASSVEVFVVGERKVSPSASVHRPSAASRLAATLAAIPVPSFPTRSRVEGRPAVRGLKTEPSA